MIRLHITHSDPARCMVIPFYDRQEAVYFALARVAVIRYQHWSWYQPGCKLIAEGYRAIFLTAGETVLDQFWPEKPPLRDILVHIRARITLIRDYGFIQR